MNVFAIGASRNIGYYAAIRLLNKGATVTFLLRSPSVFNEDETIQRYVQSGHARLVKGDALNPADVTKGWEVAQEGPNHHVDLVLFTLGGTPSFHPLKGFIISPPDLCTRTLLNVLRTMPSSHRPAAAQPKVIAMSSTGITRSSKERLPIPVRALYSMVRVPHVDKFGMERVMAYAAGWDWQDPEPKTDVLPAGWRTAEGMPEAGGLKHGLVIRAAALTDGDCVADAPSKKAKGKPYRIGEGDLDNNGWSVSRKDVAHFIVEGALKDWERWERKAMTIAY